MTRQVRQVVIVAGGYGLRMATIAPGIAKACYELAGRPVLQHLLAWSQDQHFKRVHLCLGHLAGQVLEVGEVPSSLVISHTVEPAALGVGGALRFALPFLEERFLMLYGDVIPQIDIAPAEKQFLASDNYIQLAAVPGHLTYEPCNLLVGPTGQVEGYGISIRAGHLDIGVTFIDRTIISSLPNDKPITGPFLFEQARLSGRLGAWVTMVPSLEVGSPEGFCRAQATLEKAHGT